MAAGKKPVCLRLALICSAQDYKPALKHRAGYGRLFQQCTDFRSLMRARVHPVDGERAVATRLPTVSARLEKNLNQLSWPSPIPQQWSRRFQRVSYARRRAIWA